MKIIKIVEAQINECEKEIVKRLKIGERNVQANDEVCYHPSIYEYIDLTCNISVRKVSEVIIETD